MKRLVLMQASAGVSDSRISTSPLGSIHVFTSSTVCLKYCTFFDSLKIILLYVVLVLYQALSILASLYIYVGSVICISYMSELL